MYNNVGRKIKAIAKTYAIIGMIVYAVIGACLLIWGILEDEWLSIVAGVVVPLVGALFSWLSVIVLYGFGQLVENSDKLVKTFVSDDKKDAPTYTHTPKAIEINEVEAEAISREYSDWNNNIKKLTDEELQQRIVSEDWQYEYRVLCKKELDSRGK